MDTSAVDIIAQSGKTILYAWSLRSPWGVLSSGAGAAIHRQGGIAIGWAMHCTTRLDRGPRHLIADLDATGLAIDDIDCRPIVLIV